MYVLFKFNWCNKRVPIYVSLKFANKFQNNWTEQPDLHSAHPHPPAVKIFPAPEITTTLQSGSPFIWLKQSTISLGEKQAALCYFMQATIAQTQNTNVDSALS